MYSIAYCRNINEGVSYAFRRHSNWIWAGTAVQNYSGMNDEEQEKVLEQARQAQSKKDMEILINQIGKMNQPLG